MPGFLRSVWDEPRPADPPVRVWRDWVLVGVLVPAAVLEGIFRENLPWRVLSVAVTVGLVPTLLWRRTRPLPMLAIGFGVTGLLAPLGGHGEAVATYTMAFLLVFPYAVFRWGSGRDVVLGVAVIAAKVSLYLVFGDIGLGDAASGCAALLAATALGAVFRYRAGARNRALDQVKMVERERLARDLHDTVAHHVSAIAIRAQAGIATSAVRPGAATEALSVIEGEASRALAEMRAMVRVLRRGEPVDLSPAPGLADLAGLAASGGSGPGVEVAVSGDLEGVPAPVASVVYRLAQESVTNARRHARNATRIEVQVVADETAVRLRVRDDGETGTGGGAGGAAPGFGLLGMIERADLLGGACHAGPAPGGGWTVTASVPRNGPTP